MSTTNVGGPRRELRAIRRDARALCQACRVERGPTAMSLSSPLIAWSLSDAWQHAWSWLQQLFAPAPAPAPVRGGGKTRLVVSSFNILGSNHTAPGADAADRYASGHARMPGVVQLLKQNDVDVVGFQEMQPDQARDFVAMAGDAYGLWPGNKREPRASNNSIAWKQETWQFVEGRTERFVTHKGEMRPCPIVKLRNRQTGEEVLVTNFHNAPGFHKGGFQQPLRDRATAAQAAMLRELQKQGLPVIVTGDMNEKQHYADRMDREAGLHAAYTGQRPGIDWILGTADVAFKGYQRITGALMRRTSDHAMIVTKATI